MEDWLKRRAAIYQLIKMVDENNGNININNDKVKRVFNDSDDVVRIEYQTNEIALLADADFDTMDNAIRKWQSEHS